MTKAIAQTYTTVHEYRRQITLALLAVSAVLIMIYAVNLYRVISNTLALQNIKTEITALEGSLDRLDSQYIALSHAVTPDAVTAHGFNQGEVSAFISRTASLGQIALAGHEL